MVVINLKVKTITQGDYNVQIDDEEPLSGLREVVAAKVNIELARIRFIFQGKCLEDNLKIIKSYGLKNDMALHVVEVDPSAPPLSRQRAEQQRTERQIPNTNPEPVAARFSIQHNSIFDDYHDIGERFRNLLRDIQQELNVQGNITVNSNPDDQNYSIMVNLRTIGHVYENSPARTRFVYLIDEMIKWGWSLTTIRRVFISHVNIILQNDSFGEQDPETILENALQAMQLLENFNLDEVQNYLNGNSDPISVDIDLISKYEIDEDDAHNQTMDEITTRHVTAKDLHFVNTQLNNLDAEFKKLMLVYTEILTKNLSFDPTHFNARLLNAFMAAITRVQHYRSHLFHLLSSLNLHIDNNPFHRLFPQYDANRLRTPPNGQMRFNFRRIQPTNPQQPAPPSQPIPAFLTSPFSPNIPTDSTARRAFFQNAADHARRTTVNPPSPYNNPGVDILSFLPGGLRRFFPGGVPSHLLNNSSNTAAQTFAMPNAPSERQEAPQTPNALPASNIPPTPNANPEQSGSISQIILEFGIVEADSLDNTNETEDTNTTVEPMDTSNPTLSFTSEPPNATTPEPIRNMTRTFTTEHSFVIASGPVFSVAGNNNAGGMRPTNRIQPQRSGWLPWSTQRDQDTQQQPQGGIIDPYCPCLSHHNNSFSTYSRQFTEERSHLSSESRSNLNSSLPRQGPAVPPRVTNPIGNLNRQGYLEFQSIEELERFVRHNFQRVALRFAHPDRVRQFSLQNSRDRNQSPFDAGRPYMVGEPIEGFIAVSAEIPMIIGTAIGVNSNTNNAENTNTNPTTTYSMRRSPTNEADGSSGIQPNSQMEDLD